MPIVIFGPVLLASKADGNECIRSEKVGLVEQQVHVQTEHNSIGNNPRFCCA